MWIPLNWISRRYFVRGFFFLYNLLKDLSEMDSESFLAFSCLQWQAFIFFYFYFYLLCAFLLLAFDSHSHNVKAVVLSSSSCHCVHFHKEGALI